MPDPGIGLLFLQKTSALIPRAWPLPWPQQDNHGRMPQSGVDRGTHPGAGSCFIANGYDGHASVKDTPQEGTIVGGCPGATCSSSRRRQTTVCEKQNDM